MKSGNRLLFLFIAAAAYLLLMLYVLQVRSVWTSLDYKMSDYLYKLHLNTGTSINSDNRILYLTITDQTYKEIFKSAQFRRDIFAGVLKRVNEFEPECILVDLVFAYPSESKTDSLLKITIDETDNIYLARALTSIPPQAGYSSKIHDMEFIPGSASEHENAFRFKTYIEDIFGVNQFKYGHINVIPDEDGIFRHSAVILNVDTHYVPSLPFRYFLDYCMVSPSEVNFELGERITIKAEPESWIKNDVIIPIDDNGRMYVAYKNNWGRDFEYLSFERFLSLYDNPEMKIRLSDMLEGRIVIIGDISTGISDLANTSLDKNIPLIAMFANELNTYITNNFFTELNHKSTMAVALVMSAILLLTAIYKPNLFHYSGPLLLITLLITAVLMLELKYLMPVILIALHTTLLFTVLFAYITVIKYRDNKILRDEMVIKNYEFDEARKLQLSLLPDKFPESKNFDIDASLSSASEVCGDFYDVRFSENGLMIVIGDVIGHGLKAGMMALVLKTIFSSVENDPDLHQVLSRINSSVKSLKVHMFYAGILIVRLEGCNISLISAGMSPALYYNSKKDEVAEIVSKSPPIGGLKFNYEQKEIKVSEGDIFIFYTDGLSELFNPEGDMFGTERIKKILLEHRKNTVNQIKISLNTEMEKWLNGKLPHDDISFIVLKIKARDEC